MNSLKLFNEAPTKEVVGALCKVIKDQILSGDTDPLIYARDLRAASEMIKSVQDDEEVKKAFYKSALLYGQKTFEANNAKFSIQERTTYNYSQDVVWKSYQDDIDRLKMLQKNREELIKNASKKMTAIADENGELINPVGSQTINILSISIK